MAKGLPELAAEIEALTLRVSALEKKPSGGADLTALEAQVATNTAMVNKARTDLNNWVQNAQTSIDSIDLIYSLVKPLIQGDRTSAIEQVRQWPLR